MEVSLTSNDWFQLHPVYHYWVKSLLGVLAFQSEKYCDVATKPMTSHSLKCWLDRIKRRTTKRHVGCCLKVADTACETLQHIYKNPPHRPKNYLLNMNLIQQNVRCLSAQHYNFAVSRR